MERKTSVRERGERGLDGGEYEQHQPDCFKLCNHMVAAFGWGLKKWDGMQYGAAFGWGSISERGERGLDGGEAEQQQPERKRPALARHYRLQIENVLPANAHKLPCRSSMLCRLLKDEKESISSISILIFSF